MKIFKIFRKKPKADWEKRRDAVIADLDKMIAYNRRAIALNLRAIEFYQQKTPLQRRS